MLALIAFQLSFQLITIFTQWLPGHRYPAVEFRHAFAGGAQDITYVVRHRQLQGSLMTPTTAVQDCYDQDDFIRADVAPGSNLVQSVAPGVVSAAFLSWNRIRVTPQGAIPQPSTSAAHGASATRTVATAPRSLQIILNQAWHPYWRSSACQVAETDRGNLALECSQPSLPQNPIDLEFYDPVSARGAQVSRVSWICWLCATGIALAAALWWRQSA